MGERLSKKKFLEITNKRLRDEGWENVTQFTKDSGICFSVETVRRAFTEVDKPIGPDTLAVILFKLNFSTPEVKELLEALTGNSNADRYVWPKLSDNNVQLSIDQQAALDIYTELVDANPELRVKFAEQMSLLAMLAGIDISSKVKLLQRKQKG